MPTGLGLDKARQLMPLLEAAKAQGAGGRQ